MVSIGTDADLAFVYIVRRVGFDSRSPPPSRAATSSWRISLANSFPRAASFAPFWCLIVAHFECPDMRSDLLQEALVDAAVTRQLRMEGRDGDRALAAQHRVAFDRSGDLHTVARPLDDRRADEHRVERDVETGNLEVALERVALTAVAVAPHGDVDRAERSLIGTTVERVT